MKLEGKVAIVTGGGVGIGQGIVHCLAEEGADVAVVDINRDTATKVADEVKALGRKALAIEADVTDSKQIDRLVQETIDTFGKIDILVNNVGGYGKVGIARAKASSSLSTMSTKFADISEEEWVESFGLILKTAILMSRAVVPYFIKQQSGKIINIVSEGGSNRMGTRVTAYSTMKAAESHFTKDLAAELAGDNINVNCVSPGSVFTSIYVERGFSRENWEQRVIKGTPLKRPQTPEDIGHAVAFLASGDAKQITGQTLLVNSGSVMP